MSAENKQKNICMTVEYGGIKYSVEMTPEFIDDVPDEVIKQVLIKEIEDMLKKVYNDLR